MKLPGISETSSFHKFGRNELKRQRRNIVEENVEFTVEWIETLTTSHELTSAIMWNAAENSGDNVNATILFICIKYVYFIVGYTLNIDHIYSDHWKRSHSKWNEKHDLLSSLFILYK